MLAPPAADTLHNLSFGQEDLMNLLERCDPNRMLPVGNSQHIVRVPNRDDLLLRWSDQRGADCFVNRPEDVQRHSDTYLERLGALAERGIVMPRLNSFPMERCPRLGRTVIYSVVERFTGVTKVNEINTDPETLCWLGNTLLDHDEQDVAAGDPRIWDNAKLEQYGRLSNGRIALLDVDHYLTRDPRRMYSKLMGWTLLARSHDRGVLNRRAQEAKRKADSEYALNIDNYREPLWPKARVPSCDR